MSTPVTVIDIGIGNLSSVLKALKKAGATPTLTSDPEQILQASKLILPGVGAFGAGSEALQKLQLIQPTARLSWRSIFLSSAFVWGCNCLQLRGTKTAAIPAWI